MKSTLSTKSNGRANADSGSKKRRVTEVESVQAGLSHTASPTLPHGFPQPPAGHKSTFETWARYWHQCHDSKELSVQVQLEVCRFVRAVENLSKFDDQAKNGEVAHIHALQACRSLAVSNLEVVVDSFDEGQITTAMSVLKCLSKELERANAKYMNAHNAYTLRAEAAAERVERLLGHEAERVATTSMVGASTRLTLLKGLPPIHVHSDKAPLIHSGPVQGLSDADAICDLDFKYWIQDFQAQILYQHSELQCVQIRLRPSVSDVTTEHLRHLDREEDFANFFEPEILEPVQAIISKISPGVQIQGQVGSVTGYAGYFLIVTMDVGGVARRSAIPVEFKMPYGLAKAPKPRSLVDGAYSSESECDFQMRMAGLPTLEYGRLAIGQELRAYVRVRDIANQAPANVAPYLNHSFGILTNYNQTWIVEFEKLSVNSDDWNNDLMENLKIIVSERFVVGDAEPHMAFVYAYVINEVVKDICANPNAYSKAPVDIHRQDPGPRRAMRLKQRKSSRGHGQAGGSSTSSKLRDKKCKTRIVKKTS